ncbi:MAG: N-acetyltransferase family protein [Akkermansiaceae bacterium]
MIIRDATEADLPAIVAIYNESIPGGKATADLVPITVEERRDWFREFDPDRRPCWVAEDEGKVVACVYLRSFYAGRPAYNKTAEISTYISPSHQGQGLGTRLKKMMIAECPRLGVENLLSFYFDHNEASRRVNEKLGFQDAAHLQEIAEVFGEKRGLVIAILRLKAGSGNP